MNKTLFIPWFRILILFVSLTVAFLCPHFRSTMVSSAGQQHGAVQNENGGSQRTILFSTSFPDIVPTYRAYKAIYHEAFRRMGYGFHMVYHPGERSLIELNAGNIDGTVGRIFDLNKSEMYPNIIRVSEPILSIQSVALSMDPSIKIHGWKSLKGFRITYHRGVKYIENSLYKYVDKADVIVASDYSQAFRLLTSGRVDIYLEVEDAVVFVRLMPEFKNLTFYRAGNVRELTLYPYMHRKNVDLAAELAATLRAMKTDGTYDKLIETSRENE